MILLKATGVPIDRYSYEAVELLKDIIARWKTLSAAARGGGVCGRGPPGAVAGRHGARHRHLPDRRIVQRAADVDERRLLNDLPTSFVLTPDQVDRLRAAAGRIIRESPDFKRMLVDIQGAVVTPPPMPLPAAAPAARR